MQLMNVFLKVKNVSLKISFSSSINQQLSGNNIITFGSTSQIMSSCLDFVKLNLS